MTRKVRQVRANAPHGCNGGSRMSTQLALPEIVLGLTDAVGEKLGRPASCRKVLNRDQWFVYDPVFSFVQRGARKGATGYRVGLCLDLSEQEVRFVLVHSPVIAKLFQRNLVLSSLIAVVNATADFRVAHWLYRSSKQAMQAGQDGDSIQADSVAEFVTRLEEFDRTHGFVKDMFPKRRNTGTGGGTAPVAGHTFYLLLADKWEMLRTRQEIGRLIEQTWPLFLCLYPIRPIEARSASLARNMRVRGIPQVCEFSSIQLTVID